MFTSSVQQPFVSPCIYTCSMHVIMNMYMHGFVATPPDNYYEYQQMWHLFEGSDYFPSLNVKGGINSRVAT